MQYHGPMSFTRLSGQGTRMTLRSSCRLSRFVEVLLVMGTCQVLLIYYWHSFLARHPDSDIHLPRQDEGILPLSLLPTPHSQRSLSPSCSNYLSSEDEPELSRNIGRLKLVQASAWSKEKTDELLNLRKLVLYSVHLLNKQSQANPLCVKWWANPLTTWAFSRLRLDSVTREWSLSFELEPGRVPVEVVIRQKAHDPSSVDLRLQRELTLISARYLGSPPTDTTLESPTFLACLCKTGREEAEASSLAARAEWNRTDPEMSLWPPNSSFIVTDYVNFLDPAHFLIRPGQFRNRNTNYCGSALRIIVLIHSAPGNFDKRAAVRTTFGSRANLATVRAQLVFFLGKVNNRTVQERIEAEAEEFDDLVQSNFVDSYHNLTLKHLSIFQWIYLQCGGGPGREFPQMPQHILKADDDVVLNLRSAVRVADANPDAGPIGPRHCGLVVRTASDWKAYTPRYIYPPDYFHGFLAGIAYVMRSNLIPELLQAALTTPIIPTDDIFILGRALLRQVNVLPKHSPLFATRNRTKNPDPCFTRMMVVSHECEEGPTQMLTLWYKSLEPLPANCSPASVNFDSAKRECPNRYVNDLYPSLKYTFRKITKYILPL